jgi:hypothetical protein
VIAVFVVIGITVVALGVVVWQAWHTSPHWTRNGWDYCGVKDCSKRSDPRHDHPERSAS